MTGSGRALVGSPTVRFRVVSSTVGRCAGRSEWAESTVERSPLPVAHGPGSLLLQCRERTVSWCLNYADQIGPATRADQHRPVNVGIIRTSA
jgi:hypothetical protein